MANGVLEFFVRATGTQQRTQFKFFFLPQTHIQSAINRHANAVAGVTKVLGNRRDQADGAASVGSLPITRRAAAQSFIQRYELMFVFECVEYRLRAGVAHAASGRTHRHVFDEPQGKAVFDAVFKHFTDILLIHALQQHHIQLDLLESRTFGHAQAVEYFGQAVVAGDFTHTFAAQ